MRGFNGDCSATSSKTSFKASLSSKYVCVLFGVCLDVEGDLNHLYFSYPDPRVVGLDGVCKLRFGL